MSNGLLEDIIQCEKRIKRQLANEEQRVASWLEEELAALEEELAAVQKSAEAGDKEALRKARQEARQEADALVRAAEAWCERLQRLDDRVLLKVLQDHFTSIMPEPERDHPHGES